MPSQRLHDTGARDTPYLLSTPPSSLLNFLNHLTRTRASLRYPTGVSSTPGPSQESILSLSHSLTLILSGVGTLSNPGPSRRHRSSKQFGDAIFHDMNNCRPGLCELLIEDAAAGLSSGLIHDFSPYTILEVPY